MCAKHIDNLGLLSTQPTDGFMKRQVRFTCTVLLQTLSSTYPNAPVRSDVSQERVYESGLADAGFPCHKYQLTFSSKHFVEPRSHPRQCFVASDNGLKGICGTPLRIRKGFVLEL